MNHYTDLEELLRAGIARPGPELVLTEPVKADEMSEIVLTGQNLVHANAHRVLAVGTGIPDEIAKHLFPGALVKLASSAINSVKGIPQRAELHLTSYKYIMAMPSQTSLGDFQAAVDAHEHATAKLKEAAAAEEARAAAEIRAARKGLNS